MSDNQLIEAEKAHRHVKYHLEQDTINVWWKGGQIHISDATFYDYPPKEETK